MPSLGSRGLAVAAAVAPRTAPGRARPAAAAAARAGGTAAVLGGGGAPARERSLVLVYCVPCRMDGAYTGTAPDTIRRDSAKNSNHGIFNLVARLL